MDSEKVIKRDNEYVMHTYNRNPIVLEKGHGLRAAVSYTHLDVYKRQSRD